ncbi:Rv3235 family protein [Streptomyces sp. 150FB]|uniref:Rv3235 family protein n=1 Tax=Streptomyces sp. 150FB TaxID=1576605 RepID=UPI000697980A|nr:Rv3235 family protein [Streptomyces sp. 150FB]
MRSGTSVTSAARTRRPPGRGDRRGPGPGSGRPLRRPGATQPHELFAERLRAVLSGRRPVHWMLGQTVGVAYEQLVRLAPGTPLRARGTDPVVRACRYFRPGPGVVEAAASIAAGDQVRAMAFRLEQGADLRWRCAAVEIGGDRAGAAGGAEGAVDADPAAES